jgi:glycosyltransferase involved in cell wall biosynthesis
LTLPTIAPPVGDFVRLALVHDYITQFGGAERVVLSMLKAFPDAPLYTSFYEPSSTFPGFVTADVQPLAVNRFGSLRNHHRRALPVLAASFSRLKLDHDVVLCSSSGWAHGVKAAGRKVVYCHSPARWLYQTSRYLGSDRGVRASLRGVAIHGMRAPLIKWDRRAAASADVFVANSTMIQGSIREYYNRDAEILAPPPALNAAGVAQPVPGVEPGYFLCVSRLLPYKNVGAIVQAFAKSPERLIVVGSGPDHDRLKSMASSSVKFVGSVPDEQLRWLYANCQALVAASYEDYGLTPVEAASFGRPSITLRWGGFLDTVEEGRTGLFFDSPDAGAVSDAIAEFGRRSWESSNMLALAESRSEARFVARLRELVGEEHRIIRLPDAAYPTDPTLAPDIIDLRDASSSTLTGLV